MKLSIARTSAGGSATGDAMKRDDLGYDVRAATWRRIALVLSAILVLGCIGVVFGSSKPAGAATVFASGQVFASVGSVQVNVYDPTTGNQVNTLNDGTGSLSPAGAPSTPTVTSTSPTTAPARSASTRRRHLRRVVRLGADQPLSLVFDNEGNLYVGQQGTPYIAEFNSTGQNIGNFGPVTTGRRATTGSTSSDQCTF